MNEIKKYEKVKIDICDDCGNGGRAKVVLINYIYTRIVGKNQN